MTLDTRTFREAARSVTVSYPIPFLFAVLLAFALTCLGFSLFAAGGLRWLLAGLGSASALFSITLTAYAVLKRPELLRHERIDLMHRALEIMGSADISEIARRDVGSTIVGLLEGHDTRKPRTGDVRDESKDNRNV